VQVLPTHQILKDGKLDPSFLFLLERRTLTFRSSPEMADELKRRVEEEKPGFDWSQFIFLGNEHHIPNHMKGLHVFTHPTENVRGIEFYIRFDEHDALIVE
jgi:hypothetical protein